MVTDLILFHCHCHSERFTVDENCILPLAYRIEQDKEVLNLEDIKTPSISPSSYMLNPSSTKPVLYGDYRRRGSYN